MLPIKLSSTHLRPSFHTRRGHHSYRPSLLGGTSIVCSLRKTIDGSLNAGARVEGPPAKIDVLVLEDGSGDDTNNRHELSTSRATKVLLFTIWKIFTIRFCISVHASTLYRLLATQM